MQSLAQLGHDFLMRNALAPRQLCLRLPDVSDELDLLEQRLVLIDSQDNCGTLAVLSQNEPALGLTRLVPGSRRHSRETPTAAGHPGLV
jgi:hypothetical protein